MSFCFNFDVPAPAANAESVDGNELQNKNKDNAAKSVSKNIS